MTMMMLALGPRVVVVWCRTGIKTGQNDMCAHFRSMVAPSVREMGGADDGVDVSHPLVVWKWVQLQAISSF